MASWLTTGSTAPYLIVPALAGGAVIPSTASSTAYIGTAGNVWAYRTTDTFSTISGTSQYFTDGYRRGMRQYDVVIVCDINTPKFTMAYVSTVTSTASTGGASVAAFST